MKVNQEQNVKPVTIVLETQHEVDAIYALLNHAVLIDTVNLDFELTGRKLEPFTTPEVVILHDKLCKVVTR